MKRLIALSVTIPWLACGGELPRLAEVGGAPSGLFALDELERYAPADRAYVMGHAYAVALYARALPRYLEGTGYRYLPGVSSASARVPYLFEAVIREGAELPALSLDAADRARLREEMDAHCYVTEWGERVCPSDAPREVTQIYDVPPADQLGRDEGDEDDEPTEGDEGGDDDSGGADPIDEDCESFLDPAAMDARTTLDETPPEQVLAEGDAIAYVAQFLTGAGDALAMEDLGEDTEHSEAERLKPEVRDAGLCEHSPIILDLDGDGIEVSDPARGVVFDLRATGAPLRTAWPRGDDALLSLDRDGDGLITNGRELFGNGRSMADGFEALSRLDLREAGGDEDGWIDPDDAAFAALRLWRDRARDGVGTADELATLAELGVTRVSLRAAVSHERDRNGNRHALKASYERRLRRETVTRSAVDVWFRVRALEPRYAMRR